LADLDDLLREGLGLQSTGTDDPTALLVWAGKAETLIRTAFASPAPLVRFRLPVPMPFDRDIAWARIERPKAEHNHRLSVLANLHQQVEALAATPIWYAPETATIRYYDRVCQLKPNTKEAALAKYMFSSHDFEEPVDAEDIYEFMTGDECESAAERNLIIERARQINRKTKKAFGFPVFATSRGEIRLTYTSSHR
jgi:hypothetical protein